MSESDIRIAGPGSQPSPAGYPAHPAVALGATLETFVRGRRVALLGDATTGLAELLAHRGARVVHVYDPESSRVAESLARSIGRDPRIGYAVFSDDLGMRDSAFDALIIPDLTAFTAPADVVRRARRLLSHGGVAVVASPNTDVERRLLPRDPSRSAMLDYYELYDIVSIQFSHVRMLGQAPFVGYTVADFAPTGDPEVTVDTSLVLDAEQPEWFVAIASERRVEVDPYVVVGLPMIDVADATAPITEEPTTPRRAAHSEDRAALAEAQTRLIAVTAELEKLRETRRTSRGTTRVDLSLSETQTLRLAELERRHEEAGGHLKAAESRAGDEHVRAERFSHEVTDLKAELERQRDRGTRLTKLLDEERKSRTKSDLELGMLRGATIDARRGEGGVASEAEHLRARIEELEGEHMVTQRPPAMEDLPTSTGPDTLDPPTIERQLDIQPQLQVLEQRIVELQGQVTHEKARTIQLRAERDSAGRERDRLARDHKSALKDRDSVLEERDSATESRKSALKERKGFEEASSRAIAERDLVKKKCDAALAERDAAKKTCDAALTERDLAKKTCDAALTERDLAKKKCDAALTERDLAKKKCDAALTERDEALEARDALALDSEALEREHATLKKRVEEQQGIEETDKSSSAASEIVGLEETLRARGRELTKLQRDLAESERIGRELVQELEDRGAFGRGGGVVGGGVVGGGVVGGGGIGGGFSRAGDSEAGDDANGDAAGGDDIEPVVEMRIRMDTLAESVAKREADLTAASWRISQLERELSVATRDEPHTPDRARSELEEALVAAQQELAQLRHALSSAVNSRELEAAVAEQAVLIQQLEGDARSGDADG